MPKKKSWKKPEDVKRLSFSRDKAGQLTRIGGAFAGSVYIGRLIFNNGSKHRVAIKLFHKPISNEVAARYQKTIEDFRNAGVQIPKMAMLKIPTERRPRRGEWVMASQLFGSSKKGSKIWNQTFLTLIRTAEGRSEATREFTKTANAGYIPYADLIEPFKDLSKGVIVIDIDSASCSGKRQPEERAKVLKETLKRMLESIREDPAKQREYKRLLKIARETASREMKKALRGL